MAYSKKGAASVDQTSATDWLLLLLLSLLKKESMAYSKKGATSVDQTSATLWLLV